MIAVSDNTKRRIKALFAEEDWERVSAYLSRECGENLPLVETSYHELAERIRFAVLKLSNGDFERLMEEVRNAAKDWKDCLVAAGFGEDVRAHLEWEPGIDIGT